MKASEIRKSFIDFFESKQHKIVSSAPMVVKNDPTLMFTNAGMNQFKELFLGNSPIVHKRIANSQKCLRVSGKHNDLEEVGHDTYHHTMFEMLGNWSFGDYFKKDAIDWAWEYLTVVLKIDQSRLYATVFEGDEGDGLDKDTEAYDYWLQYLPADCIINGNKKDNFWEMGESGPCGPCSEIHIDMRDESERAKVSGRLLVNHDHPQVIEIWNLVFMQFNRKASGQLEPLPNKHVDTGMGFERLCRVIQHKTSNYDSDVFTPIIKSEEQLTNLKYGVHNETDIAMRVVADHIRTIAFAIADGQLPSNNKAGYVIRRILRRAVRYSYTFLNCKEPFMYKLIPALIETMGDAYPELISQQELIGKVIKEEEDSFLRTLQTGIELLDKIIVNNLAEKNNIVSGVVAFTLYDTFGFPLDLTELILKEQHMVINRKEFDIEMEAQKQRARNATAIQADDWVILQPDDHEEFVGYDYQSVEVTITKFRKVTSKNQEQYQLVFNITPFYGESGGQVGDSGWLENDKEKVEIIDTKKENNLIVHITKQLPANPTANFTARVNADFRNQIAGNHTATHLLHQALRQHLGTHVEQKGSLVHPEYLRFDFAHFQKVSNEEMIEIEKTVNRLIRKNIALEENREVPVAIAQKMGAMALFGEKYGDVVRTIQFGDSLELCGGSHVKSTGELGFFKIISESSISSGVRRIEAVTGEKSEQFIYNQFAILREIQTLLKSPANLQKSVQSLFEDNNNMNKEIDQMRQSMMSIEKHNMNSKAMQVNDVKIVAGMVKPILQPVLKDFAYQLRGDQSNYAAILGAIVNGTPQIAIILSDDMVESYKLNAIDMIREVAKEINGGGGGQPYFATAGGKKSEGLESAIQKAVELVKSKVK